MLGYFCRAKLHAGRLHRANGASLNKCNMRSELCSNARPRQLRCEIARRAVTAYDEHMVQASLLASEQASLAAAN